VSGDYQGAHGARRYRRHGCKCLRCRVGAAEQRRAQRAAAAKGQPASVAAAPVREHVLQLKAQGYGVKRIARTAGVADSVVTRLLYGLPSHGKPPTLRLHRTSAEAILAVRLPGVVGTRRRLQALMWLGWSQRLLAARMGMYDDTVSKILVNDRLAPATISNVAAVYDLLWNVEPPAGTRAELMTRTRTRARARREGWAPPAAWDADTIDDPAATPDLGAETVRPGGRRVELEDIEFLLEHGLDEQLIADRLGVRAATVERYAGVIRDGRQDTWRTPRPVAEVTTLHTTAPVDDDRAELRESA
jgi:hypothetical protein